MTTACPWLVASPRRRRGSDFRFWLSLRTGALSGAGAAELPEFLKGADPGVVGVVVGFLLFTTLATKLMS